MNRRNGFSPALRRMTTLTLLCAITLLLGLTPLGLIPLGFINITVLVVPVVVGTLLLGWKHGLVVALVFGSVSFFGALTRPSTLVATLMGASPLLTAVLCFIPRLIIPLTASAAYRLLDHARQRGRIGAPAVAAAVGSLTNTVLYLGLMLLFYQLAGLDAQPVLRLIASVALLAGGAEALAAAVIVPPICLAAGRWAR